MNLYFVSNIIVCSCAFVGFIYGAVRFIRKNKALYGQMITYAILCVVIGRLYDIARLSTGAEITGRFQLGTLASIGSFLFFFSANYGALDSIVDDGSKQFKKYRVFSLIAPVAVIVAYFPLFCFSDVSVLWKAQSGVVMFFAALCSYYNLKHLIIPDVDFGVVKSLRPYNFLALLFMVSCIAECYSLSRGNEMLTLIIGCLTAAVSLVMLPMISYGLKKSRM